MIFLRSPLFWVGTLAYGLGLLLWGYPRDPDVLFGHSEVAGTLLVFLFFWCALMAWGLIWARKTGLSAFTSPVRSFFLALALGSLWLVVWIGILGHLGALGGAWDHLYIAMLFAGLLLAPQPRINRPEKNGLRNLLLVIGLTAVLSRLSLALLAHGFSDPLSYHLYAPRVWWQDGRISFTVHKSIAFQSTYWEYLLLWANVLMAGPQGRGLIEGQLFSQLAQVAIGGLGSLLSLCLIAMEPTSDIPFALAAAIVGFSSTTLWEMSWSAKNDWGAAFWCLSALVLMFSAPDSGRRRLPWFLAGAFGGLAFAAKYNMVLTLLPSLIVFLLLRSKGEKTARALWLILFGALLTCVPIFARNWLATSNPFFPIADRIFDSPVYPLAFKYLPAGTEGVPASPRQFLETFGELLRDNPLSFGIPLLWFSFPAGPARRRVVWTLLSAVLTAFTLYSSRNFELVQLRWAGPALLLSGTLGTLGILSLLGRLMSGKNTLATTALVLALLIPLEQIRSNITKSSALLSDLSPTEVIRNEIIQGGGASKAWLRLNSPPGEFNATSGDDELYYVSHMNVWSLIDDPVLDHLTYGETDPKRLLRILLDANIHYLLDSRHWKTYYWGVRAALLNQLISQHPEAVVFEARTSKVVDLRRLGLEVFDECTWNPTDFSY